jgi:hypothetical protein
MLRGGFFRRRVSRLLPSENIGGVVVNNPELDNGFEEVLTSGTACNPFADGKGNQTSAASTPVKKPRPAGRVKSQQEIDYEIQQNLVGHVRAHYRESGNRI